MYWYCIGVFKSIMKFSCFYNTCCIKDLYNTFFTRWDVLYKKNQYIFISFYYIIYKIIYLQVKIQF